MSCISVVVRPIEPADQDAARKVILDGLEERFGKVDETRVPDVDDICGVYSEPGDVFLVAEVDGRVCGTGGLIAEREGVGRIVRLTVDRALRRRGVGRALMTRLLDEARRQGLERVVVEANSKWEDSISLYKSCGFAEYRRDDANTYLDVTLDDHGTADD